MDKNPLAVQEPCPGLCKDIYGQRILKSMRATDQLCCASETNTRSTNYAPIKINLKKKNK